jgi:hypothetical protein
LQEARSRKRPESLQTMSEGVPASVSACPTLPRIYLFISQLPATLSKQKKLEISDDAASTLPTAGPVHWVYSSVGKQHLGRHCALGLPESFYFIYSVGNTKHVNKIAILPGGAPHCGRSLLVCITVNRNARQAPRLPSPSGREFIRFFEAGRVRRANKRRRASENRYV